MRRVLIVLAAGGVLGGAGCRHCCGDRPRLFDSYRDDRREPDCDKDRCAPTGRGMSSPRLGSPLAGQGVGLTGGPTAYPRLPSYPSPLMPAVPRSGPPDLLPPPTPETIPPTVVPLAPPSSAVPGTALLPAPSVRPAGR